MRPFAIAISVTALIAAAIAVEVSERIETRRAIDERAALRKARAEAASAKVAAENTPHAIERRRFNDQVRMLEEMDAQDRQRRVDQEMAATCRADAKCWYSKHVTAADAQCVRAIEQLARFDYKWTDGIFSGRRKFDSVAWVSRDAGTIAIHGNAIRMQNGFGVWQNIEYRCEFNTLIGTAHATTF